MQCLIVFTQQFSYEVVICVILPKASQRKCSMLFLITITLSNYDNI